MKLPKNPTTSIDFSREEARAIQYMRSAGGYPVDGHCLHALGVMPEIVAICVDDRHKVPVFKWADRFASRDIREAVTHPDSFIFKYVEHGARTTVIRHLCREYGFVLIDFRIELYATGWRPSWKR